VADLLRWIWQQEFSEVYAEAATRHYDIAIDDCGLLLITLESGIIVSLDPSWSRPNNSFPTWGDVTIEVVAERGWARLDAFRQQLAVYSNSANRTQWIGWGSDMDLGLMRDFVAMIAEGREPSITGRDGLKALEVALAAYQSAERGEPVRLV